MVDPVEAAVAAEVASLQGLNIDQLRQAWRVRFGAPPYLRSGDVMRRCLAERIQLATFGGDAEVEQKLTELARAYNRTGRVQKPRAKLQPGTTLLRDYGGKTHRVEVLAKGFLWDGRTIPSLSQVARQITGTPWSGPLFFGLKTTMPQAKEPVR